jgi:hypothetical protein
MCVCEHCSPLPLTLLTLLITHGSLISTQLAGAPHTRAASTSTERLCRSGGITKTPRRYVHVCLTVVVGGERFAMLVSLLTLLTLLTLPTLLTLLTLP